MVEGRLMDIMYDAPQAEVHQRMKTFTEALGHKYVRVNGYVTSTVIDEVSRGEPRVPQGYRHGMVGKERTGSVEGDYATRLIKSHQFFLLPSSDEKMNDSEINGAGVIVFRRRPSGAPLYLILKAKWGRHWSIPKGHRDKKSEPVLFTALRETEEETGIDQDQVQLINNFEAIVEYHLKKRTRNCPDGVKRVKVYLGKVDYDTEVVLSEEHTEFKWLGKQALLSFLPREFHGPIFAADKEARFA